MFQFPPCPPTGLCVQPVVTEYCSAGFPHSGISGSTFDDNSPELIAAIRALHRLLAPRHPPHALSSLIHVRRQHLIIETICHAPDKSWMRTCCVLLLFHSVVKVPRRLRHSCRALRSPNDSRLPPAGPYPSEPLVAAVRLAVRPTHQLLIPPSHPPVEPLSLIRDTKSPGSSPGAAHCYLTIASPTLFDCAACPVAVCQIVPQKASSVAW